MINLESHGQEINRLHQLAHQLAVDAVVNAVAAGQLLLEAKRELKHGQFQQWVKETVNVSLRQAQRYMAAAEGKRLALSRLIISDKCDTVSHLKVADDQGMVLDGTWCPTLGHYYVHADETSAFWVVPDLNSNAFHISRLYQTPRDPNVPEEQYADPDDPFDEREWDGMSRFDGTKHPVAQKFVGRFLTYFGLNDPAAVVWESWIDEGLERPFGEPEPVSSPQSVV